MTFCRYPVKSEIIPVCYLLKQPRSSLLPVTDVSYDIPGQSSQVLCGLRLDRPRPRPHFLASRPRLEAEVYIPDVNYCNGQYLYLYLYPTVCA